MLTVRVDAFRLSVTSLVPVVHLMHVFDRKRRFVTQRGLEGAVKTFFGQLKRRGTPARPPKTQPEGLFESRR
jgi:hypothetical protein